MANVIWYDFPGIRITYVLIVYGREFAPRMSQDDLSDQDEDCTNTSSLTEIRKSTEPSPGFVGCYEIDLRRGLH